MMQNGRLSHAIVTALGLSLLAALPAGGQQLGQWTLVVDRDPMTDQNSSRIFTNARNGSLLRQGRLFFQCAEDKAGVYLHVDDFLTSGGQATRVQWRFDQGTPNEGRWAASPRGIGAWLPNPEVKAFAGAVRKGRRLLVRAFDYRGVPHDLEFSLQGASAALDRLPCRLPPSAAEVEAEESRRSEEEAAARTGALERLRTEGVPDGMEYAAEPGERWFLPIHGSCNWWVYVKRERAAFFPTAEEAEAAGFERSRICR